MAAELDLEKETVTHRKGYDGFIGMMKWGSVLTAIVTAIVVVVIAS